MLTESGYIVGIVAYTLSALLALWLLHRWFLRRLPRSLRLLLVLPVAALLLTPAYTQPQAETMAPALVVSAFQWATAGREAAEHALRPLGTMAAIAAVLALVLSAIGWLLSRRRRAVPED